MAEFDPFQPLTYDDLANDKSSTSAKLPQDPEPEQELPDQGGDDLDLPPEPTDEQDIGEDDVDPIGDAAANDASGIGPSDIPNEGDAGVKLDDSMSDVPGMEPAPAAPIVKWTSVPQDNGDIWSEHLDGYVLRARSLSAKKGTRTKYIAQLFKDKKLIEKGVIWLEQGVDAQTALQNVADRILDKMGLVSHSLEQKPDPSKAAELPIDDSAPNEGDLPQDGEDDGGGGQDDLGLSDDDLDALGG